MSKVWISAIISTFLLATAVEARAQQQSITADVFGSAGFQQLWDDESSLGVGVVAGGGVGVTVNRRLVVRGRIVRTSNERDFGNGVVFDATTTRYTADALWRFSASEHAAYLGAGVGGLSFTRTSRSPSDPSVFSRSDTDFIFGGIGGVTAFARGRFAVTPEASFWWSQPNNFIGIEFSVLASFRF